MSYATRPSAETFPLADAGYQHGEVDHSTIYTLADERVVRIVRLRLIGYSRDFPFWDLSYCHGQLADGTLVPVQLEICQFNRNYRAQLIELCRRANRYGKGLGIFEAISTLPG